MKNIKYSRLSEFTKSLSDFEKILQIPHTKEEENGLQLVSFNVDGLRYFNVLISKEDLDFQDFLKKIRKSSFVNKNPDLLGFMDVKKDKVYAVNNNMDYIKPILLELKNYDIKTAERWKDKFNQNFTKNALDLVLVKNNILEQTPILFNYLNNNKIEKIRTIIDFNKKYSEEELNNIFNKIENFNSKKEKKIVGFCDLDYYPFIYEGNYVIEDVSADEISFCEYKDEKNFDWYLMRRDGIDHNSNDLNNLNYESRNYIQEIIEKNKNEFNLACRVKDGKIEEASLDVCHINLLQSFIFSELTKSKKIKSIDRDLSLTELIRNFTIQNDPWQIEERGFLGFLEKAKYKNGKFSYEDFSFIDLDSVDKLISLEKDLSYVDKGKIVINKTIDKNAAIQINEYLDDLLKRKNNPKDAVEFVDKVKLELTKKIEKPSVKRKM